MFVQSIVLKYDFLPGGSNIGKPAQETELSGTNCVFGWIGGLGVFQEKKKKFGRSLVLLNAFRLSLHHFDGKGVIGEVPERPIGTVC